MKILKIRASGLPLFSSDVEVDFLALQRVSTESAETMYRLFSNYYQNNVIAITGINASGKTTLLKVVNFSFRLLNNEPISTIDSIEIFDGLLDQDIVSFTIFFYANDHAIHMLHTVIKKQDDRFIIVEETLHSKSITSAKSKKALFDASSFKQEQMRNQQEAYLLDDVSIMVAFNKRQAERISIVDMLRFTNNNLLGLNAEIPHELIEFFDPSIEYLTIEKQFKDQEIRLKFKNKEELIFHQLSELNRYLSSGTIKGITLFLNALKILKVGGYLLVDEIENHFNKEIVVTLIRFFMDQDCNPKGAVLLFTTHYPELLDEFSRNDTIYIARNKAGITVENLSKILTRNDINKSDAYQSGYLEGTVPLYDAYMNLKRIVIRTLV
jgi:hypothetical protein